MKYLPLIILIPTLLLAHGCAMFDTNVPVEQRLESAQITLQAVEDTVPELVNSGDLTQSDADKLIEAIDKAQAIVAQAQALAVGGFPQDSAAQIGLAIDALRVAQGQVEGEQAKQNIGRTIAALMITRSVLEQQAALEDGKEQKP